MDAKALEILNLCIEYGRKVRDLMAIQMLFDQAFMKNESHEVLEAIEKRKQEIHEEGESVARSLKGAAANYGLSVLCGNAPHPEQRFEVIREGNHLVTLDGDNSKVTVRLLYEVGDVEIEP